MTPDHAWAEESFTEAMRLVAKYRDAAHRPQKYGHQHGMGDEPSRSFSFKRARFWLAEARKFRNQMEPAAAQRKAA